MSRFYVSKYLDTFRGTEGINGPLLRFACKFFLWLETRD